MSLWKLLSHAAHRKMSKWMKNCFFCIRYGKVHEMAKYTTNSLRRNPALWCSELRCHLQCVYPTWVPLMCWLLHLLCRFLGKQWRLARLLGYLTPSWRTQMEFQVPFFPPSIMVPHHHHDFDFQINKSFRVYWKKNHFRAYPYSKWVCGRWGVNFILPLLDSYLYWLLQTPTNQSSGGQNI